MKKQFLKELNRELRSLTKEERDKYLNDFEEIILDKMESGISEEDAVSGLGDVKQIANDIISSYVELDEKEKSNQKYFDKMHLFLDIIVLIIAYILSYCLCFSSVFREGETLHLSFFVYMFALVFIVPSYLILYYIFKAYTTKYVHGHHWEVRNIFLANLTGVITFSMILYLFNAFYFSRTMVLVFCCINLLLEITVRNFVFYRVFCNRKV